LALCSTTSPPSPSLRCESDMVHQERLCSGVCDVCDMLYVVLHTQPRAATKTNIRHSLAGYMCNAPCLLSIGDQWRLRDAQVLDNSVLSRVCTAYRAARHSTSAPSHRGLGVWGEPTLSRHTRLPWLVFGPLHNTCHTAWRCPSCSDSHMPFLHVSQAAHSALTPCHTFDVHSAHHRWSHTPCLVCCPAGHVVLLFILHRQAQQAQPRRRGDEP
jgi:hypothetical protein